ncbi:MAG: Gfo/Idh/MocA family oxidoreductase, partial [Kiritimatiellae bacterium]|nr:Gfo/Idh/MocA family oxidoreductase [Kiritimatiellia bacterium]
ADPEIEAVGVSAAFSLQGRIAEDLLRAGKHVFMEKPMAISVSRAEALVQTVRQTGRRLMVGYMKRYDPGNLLLKRHLDEWRARGEKVIFARNHGFGGNWVYAQDPNVPMERCDDAKPSAPEDYPVWLPEKWRGPYVAYLQQWTHNLNLLRFFLDDAGGGTRVTGVHLDEDGLTGLVVLDINGVRAVVESAYTRFHAWDEHTQIYTQGGWLRTYAPPLMRKEQSATVEIYRAPENDRSPYYMEEVAPAAWSYREEAKHFLDGIQSGAPFRSSAEDTLHDVRLYEEIYRRFLNL